MIISHALRRWASVLAIGSLALVGAASVGTSATRSSGAETASDNSCAEPQQRVRPGASHADPNSLSSTKATSFNARVSTRVRQLPSLERYRLLRPTSRTTVNVYVHLIKQSVSVGEYSDQVIAKQIAALQTAYASSYFDFRLARTIRTIDADLYKDRDEPKKRSLRVGTAADLNLFLVDLAPGDLGYASFPGGTLSDDNVVIDRDTVVGGLETGYNQGKTAVHEVGHWLGLLHTFQGGCSFVNDAITDTPQQSDVNPFNTNCNAKDTCTASAGLDPLNNFMSYSPDRCMTEFTKGQGFRMRQVWAAYRAPSVT